MACYSHPFGSCPLLHPDERLPDSNLILASETVVMDEKLTHSIIDSFITAFLFIITAIDTLIIIIFRRIAHHEHAIVSTLPMYRSI